MKTTDQLTSYYLATALQELEQAQAHNHDTTVGPHLVRALSALRGFVNQEAGSQGLSRHDYSDPYEINEFNSAV